LREQLLVYAMQPQHLDLIWVQIQQNIASNLAYSCFYNTFLFANSKDTKLEFLGANLSAAY
jgi:hypothetical protein